jgi:acyl carrier protein
MSTAQVRDEIRNYIVTKFLDPGDAELLADDTSLIRTGVLNSLAVVGLVQFFETRFGVKLTPEEMRAEHLDTIEQMERTLKARGLVDTRGST